MIEYLPLLMLIAHHKLKTAIFITNMIKMIEDMEKQDEKI
jgi:hypothetical protein